MNNNSNSGSKGPVEKAQLILPPDTAILIEARIKAGEKSLQIKSLSNLILHDPVLTLELLHLANSVVYGGTIVSDLDSAITRIGSARLIETLAQFNVKSGHQDPEVLDAFEVLRYNCRRISIISLMVSAVLRMPLSNTARMAGLFGDVGHLLALNKLGKKYCEAAKSTKRKSLAFRLEKDHKFNLDKELVKFLVAKNLPRGFVIPYNLEEAPKNTTEADLRLIVQSALELIDAFDGGKMDLYASGKSLPSQSNLKTLRIMPGQQEKLVKAVSDYLKTLAETEAPEGASLLISSVDDEPETPPMTDGIDAMRVPRYTSTSVKPKSREALQEYFDLCEQEKDPDLLTRRSMAFLKESGMFERTALVRVIPGAPQAVVEFAAGMPVTAGEKITCDNDSPFNSLHLEIKSANVNAGKIKAPFGVSAYAMGAVDILPNGDRIMMYADKTASKALPMESRHVFRLSFGLLMRSLQELRPQNP